MLGRSALQSSPFEAPMAEPREHVPVATPVRVAVSTTRGDTNPFSIDLIAAPQVQPTDIERYAASPDH